MDRELTPEEISELLAAYALDAVDDEERALVELYLARHPESRDDVAGFQVAASMLAHAGGPPPAGVWEQLESIIADAPPPLRAVPAPDVIARPRPAAPRVDRRWRFLAAAAVVVALVFGGLWLADPGGNDGGGSADPATLARAAATAPGARHASLTDVDGTTRATAVVLRDGTGYLTSDLPAAPEGEIYQLWGITKTGTVSLGVLGHHPHTVAFAAAVPTQTLAITTEVAGGVPVSRHAPDVVGKVVTS
jgi:Anti-sigma-K factor rskA, C-terminal